MQAGGNSCRISVRPIRGEGLAIRSYFHRCCWISRRSAGHIPVRYILGQWFADRCADNRRTTYVWAPQCEQIVRGNCTYVRAMHLRRDNAPTAATLSLETPCTYSSVHCHAAATDWNWPRMHAMPDWCRALHRRDWTALQFTLQQILRDCNVCWARFDAVRIHRHTLDSTVSI
jgi:hypothetical protein